MNRLISFLLLVLLLLPAPTRAQQPLPASSKLTPDTTGYAGLTAMAGYPFQVRVSPSATDKVKPMAGRLARAYEYFFDVLLFHPTATVLLLSAADHQRRYPNDAYGMPFYRAGNLVVPADPSPLPAAMAAPVKQLTTDTAARRRIDAWFNLGAVRELARAFSQQSGDVNPPRRLWLDEFFASLLQYAYFAEYEPKLLPVVETLPALVASRDTTRYPHRTLTAFADEWFEFRNYAWYQSVLSTHARNVYRGGGTRVIKRLYLFLKVHPRRELLVADEQLALRLQVEVSPEMAATVRKWPVR